MNVVLMAKHIQTLTLHIVNNFSSLSPLGWFLFSLYPIGQHLHFFIMNTDSRNYATI